VAPITTVVRDIPVRALRSISGHVYLRQNIGEGGSGPSDPLLRPLAGVRLKIGDQIAATDADGSFVLRNLPSGELTLTLVPFRDVPEGLTVPAGRVNLPREPINVENATIVISNPDLPQYLIDVRTQPGAIP
jgi:hypothetical protein